MIASEGPDHIENLVRKELEDWIKIVNHEFVPYNVFQLLLQRFLGGNTHSLSGKDLRFSLRRAVCRDLKALLATNTVPEDLVSAASTAVTTFEQRFGSVGEGVVTSPAEAEKRAESSLPGEQSGPAVDESSITVPEDLLGPVVSGEEYEPGSDQGLAVENEETNDGSTVGAPQAVPESLGALPTADDVIKYVFENLDEGVQPAEALTELGTVAGLLALQKELGQLKQEIHTLVQMQANLSQWKVQRKLRGNKRVVPTNPNFYNFVKSAYKSLTNKELGDSVTESEWKQLIQVALNRIAIKRDSIQEKSQELLQLVNQIGDDFLKRHRLNNMAAKNEADRRQAFFDHALLFAKEVRVVLPIFNKVKAFLNELEKSNRVNLTELNLEESAFLNDQLRLLTPMLLVGAFPRTN